MSRFHDWAHQNLKPGDAVVLETTGNVWDIYDVVAPLVSKTVVAHAGKVRQIAEARVTPAPTAGAVRLTRKMSND